MKTGKDVVESPDGSWLLEVFAAPLHEGDGDKGVAEFGAERSLVLTAVRNMWELECLVKALDGIETVSGIAQLMRE